MERRSHPIPNPRMARMRKVVPIFTCTRARKFARKSVSAKGRYKAA